jgi:hypothetical protein
MPNWAKLVAQGRVKSIGMPWSDEEANAVFTLRIPPAYVRSGILTIEDYEKAKASDEKKGVTIETLPSGESVRSGADMHIGDVTISVKKKGTKKK